MRVGVLAGLLTFVAGEWRCACAQWHSMPRDPLSPWLHRCSAVGGRRGRRLGARALWAWRTSGWPQLGRHAAIHAQVREVGTGTGTVGCVGRTLSVLAGVGRSEKKAKRKSGWLVRRPGRPSLWGSPRASSLGEATAESEIACVLRIGGRAYQMVEGSRQSQFGVGNKRKCHYPLGEGGRSADDQALGP